jgi:hypothetical protein
VIARLLLVALPLAAAPVAVVAEQHEDLPRTARELLAPLL